LSDKASGQGLTGSNSGHFGVFAKGYFLRRKEMGIKAFTEDIGELLIKEMAQ
jgi:hypothetical protein